MNNSIYQIGADYFHLMQEIEDNEGEFTDEMMERLEKNEGDFNTKATNYVKMVRYWESEVDTVDKEIKRLTALKKSKAGGIDRLKSNLHQSMIGRGLDKADLGLFKLSFRKSSSVVIEDATLIPRTYKTIVKDTKIESLPWGDDELKCYSYEEVKDSINLLIMLGSQIYKNWGEYLSNRGCKLISYHCGSNYVLDMENIMFKDEKDPNPTYFDFYDETWMIPQNEEMNFHYFKIMERCKSIKVVPFVWSSYFIDKMVEHHNLYNNGRYIPNNDKKNITIFEPNINVVKFAMYPMLIVESLYRKSKKHFNYLYVTNTIHIKDKKCFVKIMNHLDIVKDKVASFEARYNTPYFLSKYTDVVLSHQWGNPLNYAYLDALYLGYPLVHNAKMIKDAGYYYPNSNVDTGCTMLKKALTKHDSNVEEYEVKSKKVLDRYSVNNKDSIKIYDDMIEELFN